MRLPTNEDAAVIRRAIDEVLAEMDDTPRNRAWKFRALGTTNSEALADVPRGVRLDMRLSIPEMRVLRTVAADRGISVRGYARRAVGTVLIACDDVDPDAIMGLAKGGMILP